MEEDTVLCAASAYNKKYYFNDLFSALPKRVQDELQIMCVLFTEDVGGVLQLFFDENGHLELRTEAADDDLFYDEIGSGLKIRQLQRDKKDLFESIEMFYRVFALGETEQEETVC